jgi:hypothetical protein
MFGTLRNVRVTYANVVSTIALFVALGGGAYAVTTLPAGSVGQRQLAFPLGVATRSADFTRRLAVSSCPPGAPCAPAKPQTLASISISLKRPARLLILGSASLVEASRSTVPVFARLSADVSGKSAGQTAATVGSSSSSLQFSQVIPVHAGRQVIRLSATVTGSGDKTVYANASHLDVVALPALR